MSDTMAKYREYVITSFTKAVQPITIDHAHGATVVDSAGREYIDCFAGIAVVNAGHCNPEVIAAAREQMDRLIHAASYIYHVAPVADLAEKLAQITPGRLRQSFFGSSGAEAIEGAVKLAKLYTGKHEVVSLTASFHGRTWGTLSITGQAGRKRRGGPYAPGVAFAPVPYAYRMAAANDDECVAQCVRALEDVLRFHTSGDVAAFIAEPILGEGGIIVPPGSYFQAVKEILDRNQILFIADEVQTGFGRTGAMFAAEHYGVEPDILVTAKGIADGFPLSAFTTRPEIAAAFQPGDHLSTFGGNPVSCAAALANIAFIEREGLAGYAAGQGEAVLARLRAFQAHCPLIGEVRGRGLMIGLELVSDAAQTPAAAQAEAVRAACLRDGVLVGVGGVYGNVVRIQPPLVITPAQLDQALTVLEQALLAGAGPPASAPLAAGTAR